MRSWSILLALSVLVAVPSARADDHDQAMKDVARRYAEEGIAAHERGDEAAAVESFTRAYRVLGAPTVGIRLARSLAKLGRLLEAQSVYQEVVATRVKSDDPQVFGKAVTDAGGELAELEPRIPTLAITVAPGVTIPTLDGAPVSPESLGKPRPLDPGAHRVAGLGAVTEALTLEERAHVALQLHPPLAAAPPPLPLPTPRVEWRRIAGFTGLGLAGASLVVGGVGMLQASSVGHDPDFDAYRRAHPRETDVCTVARSAAEASIDAICTKATRAELLQAIFFPAALVFGGVSTYLLLTSGKPAAPARAEAHVSPYLGPHAAGLELTGTF